ncbi:hypothetical protein CXB51_018825 [Gossypium anomalum]|uniref:Uncharacterized protein n=1 Tax=Gossypium anomalum TaxID=47600 RepID=A0A8J5YPM4_9ROSI|nr:hypothetical protein CXB51_018825 [Gossypium anomalum]
MMTLTSLCSPALEKTGSSTTTLILIGSCSVKGNFAFQPLENQLHYGCE